MDAICNGCGGTFPYTELTKIGYHWICRDCIADADECDIEFDDYDPDLWGEG